jgi:hypothetical protein
MLQSSSATGEQQSFYPVGGRQNDFQEPLTITQSNKFTPSPLRRHVRQNLMKTEVSAPVLPSRLGGTTEDGKAGFTAAKLARAKTGQLR